MKILITGFDPFGNETVNPSYEAVKLLPDKILNAEIIKKEIPTCFISSREVMISMIGEYHPDIVLNVGQAGGRKSVTVEKQAFNMMDAPIPDNAGFKPDHQVIDPEEAECLKTTLDYELLVSELNKHGIDAYISESAGRYVCNYIMFSMLSYLKDKGIPSGFVHVPFESAQVKDKPDMPSMELKDIAKALEIILETLIKARG